MAIIALAVSCLIGLPKAAQAEFRFGRDDDMQAYVESNLLAVFYHELGHALIDILRLPIFGQEEDAADVLSVFLIDAFYEEESAVQLAYDTAFGFLDWADEEPEPAYWDVHGPDLQRYYNLVCLFYGANPDERAEVAQDLELPEERADYCADEYDQAADSWGAVLDEIRHAEGGRSILLGELDERSEGAELTTLVIRDEVAALNAEFRLPEDLRVSVAPCAEANAFYDPQQREIVMCSEFADALAQIYSD